LIKNFVWITALFLSFTTLAQDPVYQSIDKTKGLLSNTIYDLFEDNIGRIWVAHEKGLSQYDGYRFKNYQNNQEQGLSLSNIMQDGRGRIWCQNFTGQVFYVEGDQLLLNTDLEPSGVFCKAAILSDSLLFIGHHNTIRIYNTYSKVLTEIPLENQTADQNAFATSTHYYFFNREEGKLTTIDLKGNTTTEDAPKQPYFYYLKSKHSSFYIPKFPTTGMSIIKKDDTSFQYHFPKNTLIQNTAELNDSTFSLMTSSGVYFLYDYATSANRNDTWYPNKNISCIMQDKEGNGWVGTLNEGILFIPSLKTKKKFASYTFTEIGIDKQSNELLLGSTNNEVFRYNTSTGTLKKLIQFNTVHEIKSIHHNHQNTLAIGSDRFYVVRDKQVIDQHEYSVKDIRQFSDGTYAISTSIAIALLPISKNSIYTKWPHRNNTNNKVIELTMKGVRTRAIEILNDTLYGATTQGLLSFNATQHDTIFYNGKHIMAADLHADKNKLYVATYSQGILLLEHGKITSQFTSKHKKMPAVYKIQVHKNMLWALTESDIRAFNLENHSMKIYDKANGIPTDDIRDFFILRDTLYLAGQGLIYLPISSIETKINEPTLVLNEMIVNGNKINANEALTLKSTQNDVALNFSVLSYNHLLSN
jgi:ligand-binding sensor domain-containing protein